MILNDLLTAFAEFSSLEECLVYF